MAAPKKKAHALDVFEVLGAIDRHDMGFYDRLDEKARKGFAPPVVLRWASALKGGDNALQVLLVNEIANVDYHSLWEYPDLQYRLLALTGQGRPLRHEWIAMAKSGKTQPKLHAFMARFHPLASAKEIDLILSLHTRESFRDFVNLSGAAPEEIKDLNNAFEKTQGG